VEGKHFVIGGFCEGRISRLPAREGFFLGIRLPKCYVKNGMGDDWWENGKTENI